jgi:hypothetical protein
LVQATSKIFLEPAEARTDLVRNNPRAAVLLGATMGATVDNILQLSFYYQFFADTIR